MDKIYLIIAIVSLAAIGIIFNFSRSRGKQLRKPTKLAAFSMLLVAIGIIFGDSDRWIGYSLMAIGVVLAIVDMVRHTKKQG